MKGKNANISTRFFNFRLFLEGLKRLRVIGLAAAILAVTASALVPTVCWIEQNSYPSLEPYELETESLCVPAGCMVYLAPFFFFVLFSFLQKRKESDFFHAIPYTRTCVYVSFTTAALTFVWVIQLVCGLVSGILWSMIPRLVADIGGMIAYVLISMLAAAMLSAFMMLALTVSGTGSSCILLFVLFAGFVRVVAAIFLGCLETIDLLPAGELWVSSFCSPLWFLPLNVIYYWGDPTASAALMYSLPNILYSVLVTLAVFVLAGLLYKHRKSEMAGNPAPSVRTQALFRIMFTTLPALLIPLLVIQEAAEAGLTLVLVVAVLLVYFLYELITTKRPKNMLKAVPGLGIVVGICVAFTILFYAYRGAVLYEDVTTDEVKTVSLESNGFGSSTYQGLLMGDIRTDDPEIVSTVVRQLAVSQKSERGSMEPTHDYWDRVTVTIRMKGGRTIQRSIALGKKAREEVNARYMELDEVSRIIFLLPEDRELRSGGVQIGYEKLGMDYQHLGDVDEVMEIFRREFATLSDEQKREVMAPTLQYSRLETDAYDCGIQLFLRGPINGNGEYFNSQYCITEAMPETRACLIARWGIEQREANYYDRAGQTYGECADDVLVAFGEDARDSEFTGTFEILKGNITLMGMGSENAGEGLNSTFYLEAKDYARFAELLLQASLVHANTEAEDFTLTDHTYLLTMYTENENKYNNLYLSMYTLLDLSPEAYEELMEILQIE